MNEGPLGDPPFRFETDAVRVDDRWEHWVGGLEAALRDFEAVERTAHRQRRAWLLLAALGCLELAAAALLLRLWVG